MNILIVNPSAIPAKLYGGTERVSWYLGKELNKLGHKVTYLVNDGSYSDFADILFYDPNKTFNEQIPENIDIVHFNFHVKEEINKPNITTIHGNSAKGQKLGLNTVFVSRNHAQRHNSESFVYNGLDWDDYGKPDFNKERTYFHFLANAAWKVKNLKGTIRICKNAQEKLVVIGGTRLSFKMGFRFTVSPKVKFYGMVGGKQKLDLLSGSKGLIFPVLWDEPFGLAIIESMYMGCPVFGTTYGALPELVFSEIGFLSDNEEALSLAIKEISEFNRKYISNYALESFNSQKMTQNYLKKYEIVLSGEKLNKVNPEFL